MWKTHEQNNNRRGELQDGLKIIMTINVDQLNKDDELVKILGLR
jgi:hypothetical protein